MRLRKFFPPLLLLASLALSGYLLAARLTFRLGFPLDDAWIHQTYARNLALRGEWAFVPGKISAGSTAPLWTLLLAPAHRLGVSPGGWAFALGVVLLSALALAGVWGIGLLLPQVPVRWRWAGGFLLALEWHMVWAAASGMETLLAAVWATAALLWMLSGARRRGLLGFFIGAGVWVRPDLLTLLGPALWALLWENPAQETRRRAAEALSAAARLAAGFGAGFVPYLAFNRLLAGAWWPNTFYAKQGEYAVLRAVPFPTRLADELALPLVGAGMLLLPGAVWFLWRAARKRRWAVFGGAWWYLGYAGLYAWRLPVTYQHGRYLMPAMPIFFLLGLAGGLDAVRRWRVSLWGRVLSRGWLLSLGLALLLFYALGGRAYGQDVAVIESEMVEAACWVQAHTPEGSLVAAHDIGALGYFGERDILDLAGLVSPEVIPFLRDETQLAHFLDERGVSYLVTFPNWYPHLASCGREIYVTGGRFAPALGGENMSVYRWQFDCKADE